MKTFTNDHRIRVTKMLIRKAFLHLLRQRPLPAITIKALCEEAGINRGTFYTHYTDIYDLRDKIEAEMMEDLHEAMAPLLSLDQKELTPLKVTTQIFQCLKDNSDLCTVTLSDYGDKAFALKLINLGREICMEAYTNLFSQISPEKIAYFYAFASAGCIGLLQKWLADGMTASAEEMAKMAETLMLHGIGFLQSRD